MDFSFSYRFPNLQFQYKDPGPNFNRKKVQLWLWARAVFVDKICQNEYVWVQIFQVKGLVAQLIKVKDVSTATALEVAAGNKVRLCSYKKVIRLQQP